LLDIPHINGLTLKSNKTHLHEHLFYLECFMFVEFEGGGGGEGKKEYSRCGFHFLKEI
jgi:hypothetical protein